MRDELKSSSLIPQISSLRNLAEEVGFEPTEPFRAHSISNAANSTTLAPFRKLFFCQKNCEFFQIQNPQSKIRNLYGGEGGIRTHGTR